MTSNARTDENRAFPRRPGKGKVTCRLGKYGLGRPVKGRLLDVSQGGALLSMPAELKVGQEIEIELNAIISAKPVTVPAIVRRVDALDSQSWEVGCEFLERLAYEHLLQLGR